MAKLIAKPMITEAESPEAFLRDQIQYLKDIDSKYSVMKECKTLRRMSPTLISLISQNKRRLTIDRIDEVSKLLRLSPSEKFYLREWLISLDPNTKSTKDTIKNQEKNSPRKKQVSLNLLNDWLNVYVKDSFQIPEIQKNPELLFAQLSHIASRSRVQKSLNFLLKEGYLRRTLSQTIVVETDLSIAETPVPSAKVRQFHKAALNISRNSLELVDMNKRIVNTLVLPLNEKNFSELKELIQTFSNQLQEFASHLEQTEYSQLHQINICLTPTGNKI